MHNIKKYTARPVENADIYNGAAVPKILNELNISKHV